LRALAVVALVTGWLTWSPTAAEAFPVGTNSVVRTTGPAGFYTPASWSSCPKVRPGETVFGEWEYSYTVDGETFTFGNKVEVTEDGTWQSVISTYADPDVVGRKLNVKSRCRARAADGTTWSVQSYPIIHLYPRAFNTPVATPTTVHLGGRVTLSDGGGCGSYSKPQSVVVGVWVNEVIEDYVLIRQYPSLTPKMAGGGTWLPVFFRVPSDEHPGSTLVFLPTCTATDGSGVRVPSVLVKIVA
jgi:hypothetical protein